ncbi:iron chelate uptake ABC transporter family permease subunit [Nonomuraea ferruginea]
MVVHGLLGSALLAGLTTMLLAYQPSRFGNALRWLIGSVEGRVWEHLALTSWWIVGGIAVAWACSGMLAVLSPSDDHAASLGVHPGLGRAVALTVAIALTARRGQHGGGDRLRRPGRPACRAQTGRPRPHRRRRRRHRARGR